MQADVDYPATLKRRLFSVDPEVTAQSGTPVRTSGDGLD
jgi:hypothetical protein